MISHRKPNTLSVVARFFVLAVLAWWGSARAAEFADHITGHIAYPDWFRESPFLDLDEDLRDAASKGKRGLMVLFTTEGCSYCEAFIDRSLGDPALASLVRIHFHSVGLEIFDDAEMTAPGGAIMRVKHFAKDQSAGFSPTLVFFDHDGDVMVRAVGYQSPRRFEAILKYMIDGHHHSESFSDYMKRAAARERSEGPAAELEPDPLFSKPPYALDRSRFPASQPLLVLFEQRGCAECEGFHRDVLALQEVRQLLREFEVVRLDAADGATPVMAPDGSRVTPASWYDLTGYSRLPALLFFDERGNKVLGTDALVLRQRMLNSLLYVLERAYRKGWTYQRFARSKAIERNRTQ